MPAPIQIIGRVHGVLLALFREYHPRRSPAGPYSVSPMSDSNSAVVLDPKLLLVGKEIFPCSLYVDAH